MDFTRSLLLLRLSIFDNILLNKSLLYTHLNAQIFPWSDCWQTGVYWFGIKWLHIFCFYFFRMQFNIVNAQKNFFLIFHPHLLAILSLPPSIMSFKLNRCIHLPVKDKYSSQPLCFSYHTRFLKLTSRVATKFNCESFHEQFTAYTFFAF